jgi:hypothetical protein
VQAAGAGAEGDVHLVRVADNCPGLCLPTIIFGFRVFAR